jgi:hypothetical protein
MTALKHLVASLAFCSAGVSVLAQQNQTVSLQEHTTTSDSIEAVVTASSGEIKAGEDFKFTAALNRAPHFEGGGVGFTAVAPNGMKVGYLCAENQTTPPHREYRCSFRVPHTAKGGMWTIPELYFAEGGTVVNLAFKPITFRVIPDPDLVLPSSAEITVNLDQKQLLRHEAVRIQGRIQELKSTVSEYARANREGAVTPFLRQSLIDSLGALRSTEAEFTKLTAGEGQQPNAGIFFDDLRRSYEVVATHLDRPKAEIGGGPRLQRVSKEERPSAESLLALVLRPMEQNELAYKVVADDGSLTFDLEADSTPEGATVSYFRKGDSPRTNPDQTRATISKLPYAIWIIRFEKAGYKSEEREHDPFREPNHVVHVDLQK